MDADASSRVMRRLSQFGAIEMSESEDTEILIAEIARLKREITKTKDQILLALAKNERMRRELQRYKERYGKMDDN